MWIWCGRKLPNIYLPPLVLKSARTLTPTRCKLLHLFIYVFLAFSLAALRLEPFLNKVFH